MQHLEDVATIPAEDKTILRELARGVVISLLWFAQADWDAALTWATPFRRQVEAEAVFV